MPRIVLTLAVIGLAVYALTDIAGARKDETGGVPKWVWVFIVLFVPLAGPLVWMIVHRASLTTQPDPRSSRTSRTGPLAPDDDPEFLWRLDQERRRHEGRDDSHQGG